MKCFPLYFLLLMVAIISSYSFASKNTQAHIEFKTTELYFDTVRSGGEIKGYFLFKNTGTTPLIIETVQAPDGGTLAEWSQYPVIPGDSNKIMVRMLTGGRRGFHNKSFHVVSNADNRQVILWWKGYIVPGE